MSEPKTTCSSCGRVILQSTADRKGGLCAPCHRDATSPPAEEFITPTLPVSRAALDDLIASRPRDAVLDALFYPALSKVGSRPAEMTEGDIIVYTVLTFHGETLNGGINQYLGNQSGGWAHCCGPSLRKIGADKYAEIIEECIRAFTGALSPQDPTWESDLDAYWDDHDEPFEEFQARFWKLSESIEDELPDLLLNYICKNRDVFAPSSTDG